MTSLLLAAALLAPAARAGDTFTRAPVEVAVTGFDAKLKDGVVKTTWKRYKRDDFASYKLVKSASKDSPVYPEDPAIFTIGNSLNVAYDDGKLSPGTWRYRLFIVTAFGDRWMSPVVAITIKPEDLSRAAPTAADFE